jgi:hypothetical protein
MEETPFAFQRPMVNGLGDIGRGEEDNKGAERGSVCCMVLLIKEEEEELELIIIIIIHIITGAV